MSNRKAGIGVSNSDSVTLHEVAASLRSKVPGFEEVYIADMAAESDGRIWVKLNFVPDLGDVRDVRPGFNPVLIGKTLLTRAERFLENTLPGRVRIEARFTPRQHGTIPKPSHPDAGARVLFNFYKYNPYTIEFRWTKPSLGTKGAKVMSEQYIRRSLEKLAAGNPDLRKYLVPLMKEAALPISADKLPKPSPWTIPIPWDEAKEQLAANLNVFVTAGCSVRKLRPVMDPYAQFLYKGWVFMVSVRKQMPKVPGNLWVENDEATAVASKLPRLVLMASYFLKNASGGMVDRKLLDKVNPMFSSKPARLLAYGILESLLEFKGLSISGEQTPELPAEKDKG